MDHGAEDAYFKTFKQLLDAFATARKHHRLFPLYVRTEDFRKCQTVLGSSEIIERLDSLILTLKEKERNHLAESIVGRLFEVVNRFYTSIILHLSTTDSIIQK